MDASKQKFGFVFTGEKWMHPNRILNLFVLERNGCLQTEIWICLYWREMDASQQKFEFVYFGEKWMHPNRNLDFFFFFFWREMHASKQNFEFVCTGEKWMHPNRNLTLTDPRN